MGRTAIDAYLVSYVKKEEADLIDATQAGIFRRIT